MHLHGLRLRAADAGRRRVSSLTLLSILISLCASRVVTPTAPRPNAKRDTKSVLCVSVCPRDHRPSRKCCELTYRAVTPSTSTTARADRRHTHGSRAESRDGTPRV